MDGYYIALYSYKLYSANAKHVITLVIDTKLPT